MLAAEKINNKRQVELDLARGLAVFFMLNAHVLLYLSNPQVEETFVGALVHFLGGVPAAPVFMFTMGIGVAYSRRTESGYFIKRGAMLTAAGYLLNALRGFIPLSLGIRLNLVDPETLRYGGLMGNLLVVDILMLAGLSLMVIGLFKKLRLPVGLYPLAAVLFAALHYFVQDITAANQTINALLGLFWGTGIISCFPLLIWAFYPLVGVYFGSFLIRCNNKKRFYLLVSVIAIVIFFAASFATGYIQGYDLGFEDDYKYYHHDLLGNLIFTSMIVLWVALLFLAKSVIPRALKDILVFWSRHIFSFYIIHWLLIGWSVLILGYYNLGYWANLLAMLLLLIVTDRLTRILVHRLPLKI
ncbi:heparan-alpha-glucosaminide N-acetyltransferase domain-containing protein [Candidatus Contubernalis alkaliaceticus]|uniref:heparan-alpha-glucosaminide N-acetyltransferase domain-containing protein n=1 Tax=Candidatus Contubernalis alkaliaceticus TaxID=338645 RepID=UPI001F4C364D|nr:heparan-alpha-glucosaminide N-acetyltransferase domain-containing protein [Candidatus Contubernalis alkalaceticus]UNC92044.1 DUF1624 domain-containing protein [Candidatus Contubernalis alkalaceticus]